MRSDKESFFFLGSVILSLINPAPDYNTLADSGPVSYLPSINFKLLSITRYNETRNFITSHGPISATNCFSIHFQNPSISQGVGVKISHAQKDRRIQEVREGGGRGGGGEISSSSCVLAVYWFSSEQSWGVSPHNLQRPGTRSTHRHLIHNQRKVNTDADTYTESGCSLQS